MQAEYVRYAAALVAAIDILVVLKKAMVNVAFDSAHFNTACWALVSFLGYGKEIE